MGKPATQDHEYVYTSLSKPSFSQRKTYYKKYKNNKFHIQVNVSPENATMKLRGRWPVFFFVHHFQAINWKFRRNLAKIRGSFKTRIKCST